jgi:hypothetical protein
VGGFRHIPESDGLAGEATMSLGDYHTCETLLPRGGGGPHASDLKIARRHEGKAIPSRRYDEPMEQASLAPNR